MTDEEREAAWVREHGYTLSTGTNCAGATEEGTPQYDGAILIRRGAIGALLRERDEAEKKHDEENTTWRHWVDDLGDKIKRLQAVVDAAVEFKDEQERDEDACLSPNTDEYWESWERVVTKRTALFHALGTLDAQGVIHGRTCNKVRHVKEGYLHGEADDGPYDVDGVTYCGRCHCALDAQGEGNDGSD